MIGGSFQVRLIAVLGAALSYPEAAGGQSKGPATIAEVSANANPVRIDGRLDDPVWADATPVDLPFETSPRSNAPAPTATRCLLARDRDYLYLGCSAADARRDEIRAQVVDRDQIGAHDRIALYLDTFDDGQRAFVFEISAVGVQADAVFDQTRGGTDYSWNAVWSSAGRLTADGYTIEASIPFRSLRFPRTPGRHWRFFLQRMWPRSEAAVLRSARRNEADSCLLCDTDRLIAPSGGTRLANVQVTPTATAARTDLASPPGALLPGAIDPDVGIDVRWGITSEVALAATANPDFSQVEADAVQLEANSRFALFLPERRDFFLQDAELFSTPIRAVFTRAIADPIGGAKLTGRSGRYAGGVLYARDAITSLLLPGAFGSRSTTLDRPADVWVARGSRAVGASSRIGAVATRRSAEGYHNFVAGMDAFVRPAPPVELQFQLLRSGSEYPAAIDSAFDQPGDGLSGLAARFDATYTTRNWGARTRLESLGAGFRADAGFIPQVDSRRVEGSVVRRFWGGQTSWLTRIDWSAGTWQVTTQSNQLKERGVWTSLQYQGPWQTTFGINPFLSTERFSGTDYRQWGLNVSASVRPNAAVGGAVRVFRGSQVDYVNARAASAREIDLTADFRIGRRLSFDVSASDSRLALSGARIVRERIAKVLGVYGISRRVFLRILGQAREVRRDPALYRVEVDAHALRLESQVILSYRLDGQTAGFIGYSALASDARPEGVPIAVTRQRQTFFMKLSYAWRP